MTFFVTSAGLGKGVRGDLGGSAPTRTASFQVRCRRGGHTWHACSALRLVRDSPPSTRVTVIPGRARVQLVVRATGANAIISRQQTLPNFTETPSSRRAAAIYSNSPRNEQRTGHSRHRRHATDSSKISRDRSRRSRHMDNADHTCNNWTAVQQGSAQVGHSDQSAMAHPGSSNATKGCSHAALESSGGAGLSLLFRN